MGVHLVDLSHVVEHGTVTYPGLPAPVVSDHLSREESRRHYSPGTEFHIGRIQMVTNTGTYLDTPFHRYPDGMDLAQVPLASVAGLPAVVIDARGPAIGAEVFEAGDLEGRAVLVRTGWDRHWGTDAYGAGGHPHLTREAADHLVASGAALVGIDSLNIDGTSTGARPAHSGLLAAGTLIVEHLCRLDQLPPAGFEFFAVPVRVRGLGSFPVRAFARWET